jgi:hypothetical protein
MVRDTRAVYELKGQVSLLADPQARTRRTARPSVIDSALGQVWGEGRQATGHLSPEVLMEATICFWKTKKTAMVGKAATVAAARM